MEYELVPKNLVLKLTDLGWETEEPTNFGYFKKEEKEWEIRKVCIENLLKYELFVPAPTMREISEWVAWNSFYWFYAEKDIHGLYTGYITSSPYTTENSRIFYNFKGYAIKLRCLEVTLTKLVDIWDKPYYF